MKYKILIPDRLTPPADVEEKVFGYKADILLKQAIHTSQISDSDWADCDAILAWHELQFTADVISKMKKCKAIVRVGVGFDNVNLKAAKKKGIMVCNVPDYGTGDVADHAMALMLNLIRGIDSYHQGAKSGKWEWEIGNHLRRMSGLNLGIVGLGRIGTAVAVRSKAFGLNICFYDPYKEDGYDKSLGISREDDLYELAGKSDIISIHAPLTDETNRMFDDNYFSKCKKGQTLINTARGAIVCMESLYKALKNNSISAAGLDVLEVEPPDESNKLVADWKSEKDWINGRLIITPHCAFYNRESYIELRRKSAEEALRVLEGNKPRNQIN